MDKDTLKNLLIEQYDGFKSNYVDPLHTEAAKKDEIIRDFNMFLQARSAVPEDNKADVASAMKSGFNTQFGSVKSIMDPDLKARILDTVIPNKITDAWKDSIIKEIQDKCDRMMEVTESFERVSGIRNAVSERNKGEWKPTEEEKTQYETACQEFIDRYAPVHTELAEENEVFLKHFNLWAEPESMDQMRPQMNKYFTNYPEGKEEFFTAYDSYLEAYRKAYGEIYRKPEKFYLFSDEEQAKLLEKKKQPTAEEKDALDTARDQLKRRYHEVVLDRLMKRESILMDAKDKKKVDFLDVMSDVLDDKLKTLVSRMGFFRSIGMNYKLKKQAKELKDLGLSKE